MKRKIEKHLFIILCAGLLLFFLCPSSFAAEKLTEGRKLYDNIMLWVNFAILVLVFIKFARKPLMAALRGIREKLKNELDVLDGKHTDVKSRMDEEDSRINNIDQHLAQIRENILEMGKKEKEKIIEQARASAEKMIEDAKAYAGFQLAKARKQLSDEMVDIAIEMVEAKLETDISQADNEKLIEQFLVNLETVKPQLN